MQRWIKKSSNYYYLELTHFTYKDIHWLKVKRLKKIFYLCLVPPKNLKFHKKLCWGFTSGSAVKNLPALQELRQTQVGSLSWKDSPGEGNSNSLQYFCLENPMERGASRAAQFIGSQRVGHNWRDLAKIFVLVGREVKWHSQNLLSVLDY